MKRPVHFLCAARDFRGESSTRVGRIPVALSPKMALVSVRESGRSIRMIRLASTVQVQIPLRSEDRKAHRDSTKTRPC